MVKGVLNGPAHVEVIMSPKGMYDYFTHADNPDKALLKVGQGFMWIDGVLCLLIQILIVE